MLRRHANLCCLSVLLGWAAWCGALPAEEYVERISSFETDAETFMYAYHAEGKGSAQPSDEQACDGKRSLKLTFLVTEADIEKGAGNGVLGALAHSLSRSLGLSANEGEPGRVAQLGRSADALPFDWTGVDAVVFDAYNPSLNPLELRLKVKSGLDDGDPTAKFYRTRVTLPSREWAAVRLGRTAMGADLHPGGVISVRMYLAAEGTLYVDNLRFVASAPPQPETKYVRLTWTQDPGTTQTLTWQSRAETAQVRFRPSGQALSSTVSSAGKRVFGWGHGVFHEALLTGLKPDMEYDYQVRSGDGLWTRKKTFRTAPRGDEAVFTFLAGSDTKGERRIVRELLEVFEEDHPQLMIYAGDALHTGGLTPQWERWFQAIEPFAARKPVMQSTGNHEVGGDPGLVNFQTYNALPTSSGNEAYYSFDYGPVHFVCLETESGLYPEQLKWVEKDLAATRRPWKVVYFHSPPFSSGTAHGSRKELRTLLGPLFSRHHVNLVVSGHDHLYERSKPINLLKSADAPVNSYTEGTCYVVSGGAGAGLYDAEPGNWWTAALKTKVYHLCRVKVNGSKSMVLEAVDLQGRVIDTVCLEN